jgi:electron transport complex protein RnfE
MTFFSELVRGLWKENPTFRIVLGMCPTLAVTTSLQNGLGMGVATLFVLIGSNVLISLVRNVIPDKVRIPCYIVIVATLVTIVDLLMKAYTPALSKNLGIFIPLIVVNCIILGRAEAYASKNNPLFSLADGIGMGLGFTLSLTVISSLREVLGNGSLTIWGDLAFNLKDYTSILLVTLPPGGFITLGALLALMNKIEIRTAEKEGRAFVPSRIANCRQCVIGCWTAPGETTPSSTP